MPYKRPGSWEAETQKELRAATKKGLRSRPPSAPSEQKRLAITSSTPWLSHRKRITRQQLRVRQSPQQGPRFCWHEKRRALGILVSMTLFASLSLRIGLLPDFIRWGPGYKSVYYGINNTRPIYSERAH